MVAGRADPRNITDKKFVAVSIHSLIDYLTAHNFDHSISPKILTSPSAKDFNTIVQFLFKQIDSNVSFPGKFEDEIIAMFKYIRYPYNISKNGLSAVGSPHSWPQLLAALLWVIELLEYDEMACAEDENMNPDIDDPAAISEKAFFSYLRNAYISFLSGNDELYAQLEEEFIGSFENRNEVIINEIKEYDTENEILLSKIQEIENRRLYLPQLREKKRDYENDLEKFHDLISQLNKHKETLVNKKASRQMELEKSNNTLTSLESDINSLRFKISQQSISPEDVRRMSEEKEHLQASLRQTEEMSSELQKKVWDAELILRDKVQGLEEAVRLFNSMAEDLPQHNSTGAKNKRQSERVQRHLAIDVDIR
jgi:kinetochore protein NDC80